MEKKTWTNDARVWGQIKDVLKGHDTLIVYDLETTGLNKEKDRFIQLAAVRYLINDDLSLTYEDELVRVVNPGYLISGEITDLTGFTNDDLFDKPREEDVFDDVMDFFRDYPVAGYNIRTFDNRFMENYYRRQGVEWAPAGIVDVLELARVKLRKGIDVENHRLGTIGKYFGIEFKAHDARNDTMATADILKILIQECLRDDENREMDERVRPVVKSVNFWEGYRGYSRVYVETSAGTVYYDLRNYCWGNKDADIDKLDMSYIEAQAWKMAGCSSETEFKRYRGRAS